MAILYSHSGTATGLPVIRRSDDFGITTVDLAYPPRRFWPEGADHVVVESGVDERGLVAVPTPAELLLKLQEADNWQAISRRSLARFFANFLIAEDPQRRLDVRPVETLAHQVSLVEHVLSSESLRRVLIADEVGLGKTVEAGLILQRLLSRDAGLRILYLAPARLVGNVCREFDKLELGFRRWSSTESDARLHSDPRVVASIHRATHPGNFEAVARSGTWDVVIVDECHHLSAWSPDAGDPTRAFSLVRRLIETMPSDGRVILMSGTPHQGHQDRFQNLLTFLRAPNEPPENLSGRVIYRTKDDVVDWDGNPLFPSRAVNPPTHVDLGPEYRRWLGNIHAYYSPGEDAFRANDNRRRAAGWRCAQAMQWAASSPQAGLGYLVRQAMRSGWTTNRADLRAALAALRPYRLGPENEDIDALFGRIYRELDFNRNAPEQEDLELGDDFGWQDDERLGTLLNEGIQLVTERGDEKWDQIRDRILRPAGDEKVVFFAQPIETVTALARYLERMTGQAPALIIGGQSEPDREAQVAAFRDARGKQFLVSSRAGGEGFNLQVARRLVHIDVPWNPMDLEQRVGRVHRFGSRDTIIVDTVVVQDSREAEAFRIARERLRDITVTLVEPDRFETVFSRVMALLPQDRLQELMLNAPAAPIAEGDREALGVMIRDGFQSWQAFHKKYGEQREAITSQSAGLANWEHLADFLETHAGATRLDGYNVVNYRRQTDGEVVAVHEKAVVLALKDRSIFVCGDYGESQVYGPAGQITPRIGLNRPVVSEALNSFERTEEATGPAHLRWPSSVPAPATFPFYVLGFRRQKLQRERDGSFAEHETSLRLFSAALGNQAVEVEEANKRALLAGLMRAGRRTKSTSSELELLLTIEREIHRDLSIPSENEIREGIRYAVTPILAAIVWAPE